MNREEKNEQLFELYQTAMEDIEYLLGQYGGKYTQEAVETINKLVKKIKQDVNVLKHRRG